jgi:hypothetical protein
VIEVRSRFLALAIVLFALNGCGDDSPGISSGGLRCDPDAVPTLLASKYDDDDGDGRPLDEAFPTIDDEDDDIADHTWIRDHAGQYHLFFHNEGRGVPWFIEHYTTTDFESLHYVGRALEAQPGAWDAGGAWAPHVIEVQGTYYMFYTGIESIQAGAKQRIGLAVSSDLHRWERAHVNRCPGTTGDGCIYECDQAWTTWGDDSDPFNQQCRDAFVMRDDEHERWLMFATARSTNGYGVVTVAWSSDLTTWTGAGFINATRRLTGGAGAQTTGGQCENPFVVSREGTNYLLFTDWQDPEDSLDVATPRTIVQYATSPSLDVDTDGSTDWTYRGYIPDPGVNAIEVIQYGFGTWIMSQSLSNPHSGYVKPIRRMLRLKCIDWGPGVSFSTTNVGFGDVNAAGLVAPEMKTGGLDRPPASKH